MVLHRVDAAGAKKIDLVGLRQKDMKKQNDSKIQTPEMKKDIERSRDWNLLSYIPHIDF
jgi:hypothetical protein